MTHSLASYDGLPTLLTCKQVATVLSISPRTVLRLIDRGELRSVRIGGSVRVRLSDVDTLVEAGTVQNDARPADEPGAVTTSARQGRRDET